MKNLKFASIFITIIIVIYQIPNFVVWFFGHSRFKHIPINHALVELVFDAIGIMLSLLFLLSITYKKIWDGKTFKKMWSSMCFVLLFFIAFFMIKDTYNSFRAVDKLYAYYKKNSGISGNVFMVDDTLGHRGVPNGLGQSIYPLENAKKISVPIKLDNNGFRIPMNPQFPETDSLMMFLGCSFTWGDYVLAEQNYSSLTVNALNYKPLNCGIDAYGLAQMLILAERNIPKYHPRVLSVQYSPWLADRARFMFFPSAHGVMPFPFVTQNENKDLFIHTPLFRSALYNPEYRIYKTTPASFLDKLSFIWNVGIPVAVFDKWKQLLAQGKIMVGLLPSSEKDNQKIEKFVYERMYDLCKQYGVKMVVLNIGGFGYSDEQRMTNHYDRKRFQTTMKKELVKDITFIDADSTLRARIRPNENYSKYVQWGKINTTDSIIYDNHPNVMAHKIIAETLVQGIKKQ